MEKPQKKDANQSSKNRAWNRGHDELRDWVVEELRNLKSMEVYTPSIRRMGVLWQDIEELIAKIKERNDLP